jgi:hypothetical protein
MLKAGKRRRLWWKITYGAVVVILVIIMVTTGVVYWQIQSITLEDIQSRHNPAEAQADHEAEDKDVAIPSILSQPIKEANGFANKPIKTQDALDAAAILLQSGLSLQEIYYLTGQTKDNLSTEEKQRIRDLLLAKLTSEEIKSLRSITSQYGKHLIILDPNYPIELVGVYDEEERARIRKQLESKQTKPFVSPVKNDPGQRQLAQPKLEADEEPSDSADQHKLADIQSNYEQRLLALQSSCKQTAESLLNQAIAELRNAASSPDKQVNNQELLLSKISSEEERCDSRFASIINQATDEFIRGGLDGGWLVREWEQKYEKAKTDTRLAALNVLSKQLKKSS